MMLRPTTSIEKPKKDWETGLDLSVAKMPISSIGLAPRPGTTLETIGGDSHRDLFALALKSEEDVVVSATEWGTQAFNTYNQCAYRWLSAHPETTGTITVFSKTIAF